MRRIQGCVPGILAFCLLSVCCNRVVGLFESQVGTGSAAVSVAEAGAVLLVRDYKQNSRQSPCKYPEKDGLREAQRQDQPVVFYPMEAVAHNKDEAIRSTVYQTKQAKRIGYSQARVGSKLPMDPVDIQMASVALGQTLHGICMEAKGNPVDAQAKLSANYFSNATRRLQSTALQPKLIGHSALPKADQVKGLSSSVKLDARRWDGFFAEVPPTPGHSDAMDQPAVKGSDGLAERSRRQLARSRKTSGTWEPEPQFPAGGGLPAWASELRASVPSRLVMESALSVPCSALEPLCAGLRQLTQRVVELRTHLAQAGTQEEEKARSGGRRASNSTSSSGGHGGDVWLEVQSAWSPSPMRLWTRPSGSKASDYSDRKDPRVRQKLRDFIASVVGVRDIEVPLGNMWRQGQDWNAWLFTMTEAFSFERHLRLDQEPRVMFYPQAGVHQSGRLWSSKGQVIPLTCRSHLMDGSLYPVPPRTEQELGVVKGATSREVGGRTPTVVSVASIWTDGPAHLIFEALPRVLASRQLLASTPDTILQVISTNAITRNMLHAVGLEGVVKAKTGKLAAPMVVLPESTPCGKPSTGQMLLIRRFVTAGLGRCPSPRLAADHLLPASFSRPVLPPRDAKPAPSNSDRIPPEARRLHEDTCDAGALLTAHLVSQLGIEGAIRAVGVDSKAGQALACAGQKDVFVGMELQHVVPASRLAGGSMRVLVVERKGTRELRNHRDMVRKLKGLEGVSEVEVFAAHANNPDAWTFWRQWSKADVVVAPHGAGLANMVALPPWAHVVEVLARHDTNFMYAGAANRLGLRYHALVGHDMRHNSQGSVVIGEVLGAVAEAAREVRELQQQVGSEAVAGLCKKRRRSVR